MRTFSSQATATTALAILLCCFAAPAGHAQGAVDPRALDQLQPGARSGTTKLATTPQSGTASGPTTKPKPVPHPAANVDGPHQSLPPIGKAPPGRPLAPPVVPPAPPPPPVLPPLIEVPTRPAPPLPQVPVTQDAPGVYSKLPGGLRVTFGEGRADLNAETLGALRALAHSTPTGAAISLNVTGYAAGTPDDPSTARRLSLSRALAVRAVLLNEGIPSIHIYIRALGAASGDATVLPDRADVVMQAEPPTSPSPTAPTPAPSPASANPKAAP